MIQRLQSVFLGLIILITATLCGISILHLSYGSEAGSVEYLMNFFYFRRMDNGVLTESHLQWELILLAALVIGLSLYILLDYKNRVRQIRFTWVNLALILALVIAFIVKAYQFVPDFQSDRLMLPSVFGIALLLFPIYLNVRVYYLVKRDEDLVRSADRIR